MCVHVCLCLCVVFVCLFMCDVCVHVCVCVSQGPETRCLQRGVYEKEQMRAGVMQAYMCASVCANARLCVSVSQCVRV